MEPCVSDRSAWIAAASLVPRTLATVSPSRSTRAILRQRLEVIGAGAFGRKQQEHQIDRLVVQRLEIDRRIEPREDAGDALHAGELAVRNGDAVADPGRAQTLALQDRVEDFPLGDAGDRCGPLGQQLQQLLLRVCLERRHDRRHIDEIAKIHFQ